MDKVELIQLIQRLLREFPRHRDIIALCEACEALARARPTTSARTASAGAKPPFDRTGYQREYMRKRRAATATAVAVSRGSRRG